MPQLEFLAISRTAINHISVIMLHRLRRVWGCDIEGREVITASSDKRDSKWDDDSSTE